LAPHPTAPTHTHTHTRTHSETLNSAANGLQQKLYNLNTLNQRVLRKLSMQLTKQHMADIANGTPGAVERALKLLRLKLAGATEESIAAATAAAAGFGAPAGGGGSPHTGCVQAWLQGCCAVWLTHGCDSRRGWLLPALNTSAGVAALCAG
jgi:hypothetical protein